MLKQHVKYTDFNGMTREEDLYFNLTESELVDIQTASENGIQADLEEYIASKDVKKLLDFIKMLVNKSYGIKSSDGRHFRKSPEIVADFENSAVYSDLLLSLFQEEGKRAEAFITGLMPADLVQRAMLKSQGQGTVEAAQRFAPSAREIFEQSQAGQTVDPSVLEPHFNEAPPIGWASDEIIANPDAPVQTSVPVEPTRAAFKQRLTSEEEEFLAWKAQRDADGAI